MFKKNGSGNKHTPIDMRFALKTAKPIRSSRKKVQTTGIAIFLTAVILLALILLAVAVFIYIRSTS